MIHNEQVYKTVPFKSGEKLRILEEKDTFGKGEINSAMKLTKYQTKQGIRYP